MANRKYLLKPRLALAFLLFFCWHSQIGTSASARNQQIQKNLRIRIPSSLLQMPDPADSAFPDQSNESELGPFGGVGNVKLIGETRKKKTCGISAVAARSLVGPTMKRSYFANTPEEVEEKIRDESRQKRDVEGSIGKRNDLSEGPLPWVCLTKYEWEDMGADHYPRFVRTAECKSKVCFNGFFRCKPRRYKTKVLRRITGTESTSCEEDDVSLPESLRNSWRFITVTINLCCDCTGRIPGTEV